MTDREILKALIKKDNEIEMLKKELMLTQKEDDSSKEKLQYIKEQVDSLLYDLKNTYQGLEINRVIEHIFDRLERFNIN